LIVYELEKYMASEWYFCRYPLLLSYLRNA
jgi:hypothetical protein